MKLVADEGVDGAVVRRLRADGHSVLWIAEVAPGSQDASVLERARSEDALLTTEDKDFGELVFGQQLVTSGVLLLRLSGLDSKRRAELVSAAIGDHGREMLGAFSVLSWSGLRIRRRLR